jgi:hypothetical protein
MRRSDTLNALIAGAIAIVVSFVLVQSATAVVYKWKDEKGDNYFTDDLSKVPLQFRSMATIETVRGTGKIPPTNPVAPAASASAPVPASTEKQSKTASISKKDKSDSAKKAEEMKKMAEEIPLIRNAIAHLESEIKRDEEMTTYLPTTINGKYMVEGVQRLLPAKSALAVKISKSESPSLKGTFSFLSASIVKDSQEQTSYDQGMQTRTYQLLDRLKAELATMKQLVSQLNGDLTRINQTFAAPTPFSPPPELPKMEVIETPETPEATETADAGKAADMGQEGISSSSVGEGEDSAPTTDKGGTESFEKISDILKKGGIKLPKMD